MSNADRNIPRADPLVLDLDGDGIELEHVDESNVFFDFNNANDNVLEHTLKVA